MPRRRRSSSTQTNIISTDDSSNKISQICDRIRKKLSGLSNVDNIGEQCIYKFPDRVRSQNKEPYEPQMLSIGPYHHGKQKVQIMENVKLIYLKELLNRSGEKILEKCVEALADHEAEARRWYMDKFNSLSGHDDFVEMLVLDGCFVVEFLRKTSPLEPAKDGILRPMGSLRRDVEMDLLAMENQVPFFILVEVFLITKSDASNQGNFSNLNQLAQNLISVLPSYDIEESDKGVKFPVDDHQFIHLLDLVYKACTSSFAEPLTTSTTDTHLSIHIADDGHQEDDRFSLYFIASASELHQISGVKFQGIPDTPWLQITWENGVVKIPPFVVDVHTERLLRNLIAYEHHYVLHQNQRRTYITDYAIFMHRLTNSARDVQVLCKSKIIFNKLIDDHAVSDMFSRLIRDVYTGEDFFYGDVFNEVKIYAKKRRHIWWTKIKRTYFSTPWSFISFAGAVVALILAFLETLFTILNVLYS